MRYWQTASRKLKIIEEATGNRQRAIAGAEVQGGSVACPGQYVDGRQYLRVGAVRQPETIIAAVANSRKHYWLENRFISHRHTCTRILLEVRNSRSLEGAKRSAGRRRSPDARFLMQSFLRREDSIDGSAILNCIRNAQQPFRRCAAGAGRRPESDRRAHAFGQTYRDPNPHAVYERGRVGWLLAASTSGAARGESVCRSQRK